MGHIESKKGNKTIGKMNNFVKGTAGITTIILSKRIFYSITLIKMKHIINIGLPKIPIFLQIY